MTVPPEALSTELIDGLLAGYQKPEDLIGENGLLKQLTKALVERALEAEMAEHLGHARNEPVANPAGNTCNGKSKKTLKGEFGELPIEVPRDRHGSFEPQLIPKHQTRWTGFDDKIISLYTRGMTVREIQSHLEEMYGTEVSPTLISSVTDAVSDEVKAWQSRPVDPVYPIVYLDCIHVKVRDTGAVRVKAVYLAIGINMNGEKEVLVPDRVRGKMGGSLSAHRAELATQLVSHHPVLRLPAGDQAHHLHHQRHRVGEHKPAQDHQEPRLIPERRITAETVLSGADEHQPEMDHAAARLESGAEPVYHPIRGSDAKPLT